MHDNFNPETRNSKESVFSVQMSVNDGSGRIMNGNYGDVLNFPFILSPGRLLRIFSTFPILVNHFKTDAVQVYQILINFNDIDVNNDEGYFVFRSIYSLYRNT